MIRKIEEDFGSHYHHTWLVCQSSLSSVYRLRRYASTLYKKSANNHEAGSTLAFFRLVILIGSSVRCKFCHSYRLTSNFGSASSMLYRCNMLANNTVCSRYAMFRPMQLEQVIAAPMRRKRKMRIQASVKKNFEQRHKVTEDHSRRLIYGL